MGRARRVQGSFLLAAISLLGLSAPLHAQETGSPPDASRVALDAARRAEAWLELIDGGRYESAWEAAGEELRSVVTVRAWERRISSLRQGIGALRERSLASTERTDSLPGGKEGDYVVATYRSTFGILSRAVETVIVARQAEGAWAPVGYFVQPAQSGVGGPATSRPTR